jgi:hypothetical protein
LMCGLDNHRYAERLEHAVQANRNFSGHLFLNLKTFCIDIHKSRELRNPNNSIAREIADVGSTDDRGKVVFAMRLEGNVSQHDNLVIARDFVECPTEVIARLLGVAGEPLFIGPDNPSGRP